MCIGVRAFGLNVRSNFIFELLEHSRHPINLPQSPCHPVGSAYHDLRQTPRGSHAASLCRLQEYHYNDEDVSYVKDQFTMKRRQLLANGVG